MADGALNLKMDAEFARRINAAADRVGLSKEALALQLIEQHLSPYENQVWIGDDPQTTPIETPSAGEPVYELEDVLADFSAELHRRRALKA